MAKELIKRKTFNVKREVVKMVEEKEDVMEIKNIIKELPTNGFFKSRTLDEITGITVHHSASLQKMNFTCYDFAQWHIDPKGRMKAPAICYHFSIDVDGTVYQVNEITAVAWHACKPANNYAIGVELTGNFEIEEPTEAQMVSLRLLISYLELLLNRALIVRGHKEEPNNATACPGKNLMLLKSVWR